MKKGGEGKGEVRGTTLSPRFRARSLFPRSRLVLFVEFVVKLCDHVAQIGQQAARRLPAVVFVGVALPVDEVLEVLLLLVPPPALDAVHQVVAFLQLLRSCSR